MHNDYADNTLQLTPQRLIGWAVIALLHVGLLYVLQSGLAHRAVAQILPQVIFAQMLTPAAPTLPEQTPQPAKPQHHETSRPVVQRTPVVNTQLSENAITLAPAPPAPPAAVTTPAPAPVVPPKFDAAYLNNTAPDYPSLAKRMGEQGRVLLQVLVSAQGRASDVRLHKSSGSTRLDEAAIRAVSQWHFIPARQGDQTVDAWVVVPILFKLET